MISLFPLFILVTAGALVSSLTGLGGGSLILAGLLLVYPPELAIPLHSFTQFTANALRAGWNFRTVHWRVVGYYSLLMFPMAWIAANIFHLVNPSWLKIVVGFFILLSIIPFNFIPKSEPRERTFVLLGGVSGFLGVFVGSIGPMVTPFFNRLKLARNGMIATKSAGQLLLQLSKIIAFSGAAGLNLNQLKEHIGVLVLGSIVGVAISIPIGERISDEKFNKGINILLGLIGIKILYEGFSEILNLHW